MKVLDPEYDYAGFLYTILYDGMLTCASPHVGQHPAAGKAKHIRAAVECYLDDQKAKTKKVKIIS